MKKRLKIAIQKSGRMHDGSLDLLRKCGVRVENGRDQLRVQASNFPVDILYLRNSDIPQYLIDGVADVGIVGENLLVEKQKELRTLEKLGFSKCRLSIATPKEMPYQSIQDLQGKKIATSYPNSLQAFLQQQQIQADIHVISGSVEIAPSIGLADAVCDLVSSGSTLFKNGLEEKEVLFKSQACLVSRAIEDADLEAILEQLLFRLRSVITAKNYRYLLMNVPNEQLDKVIGVLPGMKSPTVVKLAEAGWSSVHTVIGEDDFWEITYELKANGAEGILIIPIEKMIL
ncbi:MAG: ATP phosphoribosyltransferase [Bacteroidota bacterium]